MKILVVTTWLPTAGHPETGAFVARDIEMLRADHDVEVLHLSASTEDTSVDFPVTRVPMSPSNPLSIARAARVIAARAAAADLIHSMAASALLPFRNLRLNRPWVHTEHWSALLAPSTAPLVARAALPLTARLLARPDIVISVGHDLAAAIARRRSGPTVVIPNAVIRPEVRQERPASDSITLVGVGGLISRKGPDIAIGALADLVARGVDARLIWAGDGPMRGELSRLAESLGVTDRWDLRGRVAPETVPDVVAEGDVFVLPTQMETFGVAIAEALVAGRPVVVGASGEQASFVAEPDGVLVAERSAGAFADGIQRAIALNEGRTAAEIAERATQIFDPEIRRRATADAYATARGAAPTADVEVVIAAHDARRRVDRAVSSALSSMTVARVLVICHNVDIEEMAACLGAVAEDERVVLVAFRDTVRSPAGPFNAGIELCTEKFIAIMGSDDELTPGAIDAWRRTASETRADVIIAPLRHAEGARVPTPPTLRHRGLRGARDRLAYRTAPLGLFSRARFGGLRLTPDLATGEDLAFTTRMWFSGASIVRHRAVGEYLIHDGEDRVTFTVRPVHEELRAVELLLIDEHTRAMSATDRTALAAKLWRISIFGAVHYRVGRWAADDRAAMSRLTHDLRAFAPAAPGLLSRADAALIDALADEQETNERIDNLSRARRRFFSPAALLPAQLSRVFAREAPLRFAFATWWSLR
ncbi:glycosyltransferase [Microbacterium sp. A84]|uniref:glycosyltransferase n=1 Tax=Microbacterium sp. A84 TaxID=3450715 RepID=UPI003F41F9B1